MKRLKMPTSLATIMGLAVGMSCMGGYNDPFIKPNNSVVVMEDKRRVGEPHTDKGAIIKPYHKKDKLTRKERKKRYETTKIHR